MSDMSDSNMHNGHSEMDFLKQEFDRFRAEMDGLKTKLTGQASDALGQLGSQLDQGAISARLASLEAEFERLGGKLRDTGKDAAERLESSVKDRPLTSLAAAFGIGLLAAQILRR